MPESQGEPEKVAEPDGAARRTSFAEQTKGSQRGIFSHSVNNFFTSTAGRFLHHKESVKDSNNTARRPSRLVGRASAKDGARRSLGSSSFRSSLPQSRNMSRGGAFSRKLGMTPAEAAVRLQRFYRKQLLIYKRFGVDLFCMKGGSPACHGTIEFVKHPTLGPAPFLVVADTSSPIFVGNFLFRNWKLPLPEVIITVSGGAQDFDMSPQLLSSFTHGLTSAASSAKAWILTAGTDTGVMKLVGMAMCNHRGNVPVVGIGPWGCIDGRERLAGSRGSNVPYGSRGPASSDAAPLNPFHTHFLFVDGGQQGSSAWGSEIELRAAIEDHFADTMRVPLVRLATPPPRRAPFVVGTATGASRDVRHTCPTWARPTWARPTCPSRWPLPL